MKNSVNVTEIVKQTILQHQLIQPDDSILVAVSGGADSVCLLHVLNCLKEELGIHLSAAHLNHGLRGAEADRDEEFVKVLCDRLGVSVFCERIDVAQMVAEQGMTLEEAGRTARYQYFVRLVQEHGLNKIATAHNQNDQAETMLIRIMRGTGLDGLRGIRYFREDGVIRPLLDVPRKAIENYCAEQQLDFCTDSTNFENLYVRNRVRHELLPIMEDGFNPQVVSALASLANNAAEDAEFLDGYANRLYERINSPLPSKKPIVLHIESLTMVGRAIQARLILIAARKVRGNGYRLEKKHISDVLALAGKQTGSEVHLPDYLVVKNQYGWLEFSDGKIDVEGNVSQGFCVEVEPGKRYVLDEISKIISLEVQPTPYRCGITQMMLEWKKLDGNPLVIRSRRRGERIVLYKDGREKKLKRYFIDEKIPRGTRDRIPILCCGDEVAAIIGHRIAEPYKPDRSTEKVLVITYEDR